METDKFYLSAKETLNLLMKNDIINEQLVQETIQMKKKEELLAKHSYSIWEDKNGLWHTYLPDKLKGRIHRKRNTRKEIEDIVVDYWKKQELNPTLKEIFEECMNRRLELGKICPSTHLVNTQVFKRHYSKIENVKIRTVDEQFILEFLEEQAAQNITAKAFANLKCITKQMFKRAKQRKLIDFQIETVFNELDPLDMRFKKNIKEDYQEVFMEEELPIMLEYLQNNVDLWNLGILLLFVTGVRIGELVTLKYSDFERHKNYMTIKINRTESKRKDGNEIIYYVKEFPKTEAGVRTVIVPEKFMWIYDALRKINPFGEYIFMNDGKRMTTWAIRKRMYRVCNKLPEVYKKSPHKARKTYASILLDNHLDQRIIMSQMGHTDIACTENFYHRNRRNLDAKADIINQIKDFG